MSVADRNNLNSPYQSKRSVTSLIDPGNRFIVGFVQLVIGSSSTDSATGKASGTTLSSLHQTTIIIIFFCALRDLDIACKHWIMNNST